MSTEGIQYTESFKAAADLSAKQHYLVKISAADTVALCADPGDKAIGVLLNKPAAAGRAAQVQLRGVAKVVTDGTAGAGIAAGDAVGTDGDGKAIVKSTDKDRIIGHALEASTADGAIISVLLEPGYLAV